MSNTQHSEAPILALGVASAVLGSIALMLFFLPILSIPIGICGLVIGVIGLFRAPTPTSQLTPSRRDELRWAIIGCAVCFAVMVLGFIIAYAPLGEIPSPSRSSNLWTVPVHPPISPPARPQ